MQDLNTGGRGAPVGAALLAALFVDRSNAARRTFATSLWNSTESNPSLYVPQTGSGRSCATSAHMIVRRGGTPSTCEIQAIQVFLPTSQHHQRMASERVP